MFFVKASREHSTHLPEDVAGLRAVDQDDFLGGGAGKCCGHLEDPYRLRIVFSIESQVTGGDFHPGGGFVETRGQRHSCR